MVDKQSLTNDELHWLKALNQGTGAMLTIKMADRLKDLGLAEQKLGGTGISAAGKRLISAGRS